MLRKLKIIQPEAYVIGIPMSVTDRCEIASLLINIVAEVVPFDAQAISEATSRLLTDKELYQNYKANTQVIVEQNFSIKATIDRIETVYRYVVANMEK